MDPARQHRLRRLHDSVDTWFGAAGATEEHAAMIETAFLMAAADGKISAVEHEQLVATIAYVTGDRIDGNRLRVLVGSLTEMLQLDGWDARVESVALAMRDPGSRRNAYRLAAGVSFIDGHIHPDEMQLFGMMAGAFEIPLDEASHILREVRDVLFGPQDEPILLTQTRRRTIPG